MRIALIAAVFTSCTPPSAGPISTSVERADAEIASDANTVADTSLAIDAAKSDASLPVFHVSENEAEDVLFGSSIPAGCDASESKIECLIGLRYAGDARAKEIALSLFRETGDVAGVGKDEIMDGGFRGKIHLVPELPMGQYRDHLSRVADAAHDFEAFFSGLYANLPLPHYRWRALTVRFMRSVDRTTPSAYALPWTFSYNVKGSLLTTATGVRETLFHEFFHMNDEDHGDWAIRHLSFDYDAIVKKCGTSIACLAPYAPGETIVRGGTYYAFQPNNGAPVREYGAELALRYYKEERAMLRDHKLSAKPFKCGPPENARAWQALITEFFGARDLTPACAAEP